MSLYTSLKKGMRVGMCKKVASANSSLREIHIGQIFKVTGYDCSGRHHNRFISIVYLEDNQGKGYRASIAELATLNPNFEPEAEFIVCVGCGATISEDQLRIQAQLRNIKSCPSCGMLEPHES